MIRKESGGSSATVITLNCQKRDELTSTVPSEAGNKADSGSASSKGAEWTSCDNQSAFLTLDELINEFEGMSEAFVRPRFLNLQIRLGCEGLAWLERSYQSILLQIKVTGSWLVPVVGSSLGGDTGTFQQRFPSTLVIFHHHSPLWILLVLTVSLWRRRRVRRMWNNLMPFDLIWFCTKRRERFPTGLCSTSVCFDGTVDSSIKVYLTRSLKPGAVGGMLTETARTQPLLE